MDTKNKRIMYAFAGICLLVLIAMGVYFYLSQKQSPVPPPTQTTQSQTGTSQTQVTSIPIPTSGQAKQGAIPTAIPGNTGTYMSDPSAVARAFYIWYTTNPQNVITSGIYKNSPYLTDGFKSIIAGFAQNYNPKYDPVFCLANRTESYNITPPNYSANDDTKLIVQITTKDPNSPQPLYDIILQHAGSNWKIDDVQCD